MVVLCEPVTDRRGVEKGKSVDMGVRRMIKHNIKKGKERREQTKDSRGEYKKKTDRNKK